ncbi:TPA: hypothetical protein N0F65_012674 [Lagenidium giganteum]|uniref:AB hydrolase-1 domain-containing protein n=1 Tax=Lagenidium giganteum TaxID=4803 RepID=A0AAV2YLE9_9STRA|nr:TPA: hypothetical protein N0F65_012674 [Lagenidium giganteum]
MRGASAFTLAVAAVVAFTSTADLPVAATKKPRLNGWYNCSRNTLAYGGARTIDEGHSDGYYIETKGADHRRSKPMTRRLSTGDHRSNLPFLQHSLETFTMESEELRTHHRHQHERHVRDHHHHHHDRHHRPHDEVHPRGAEKGGRYDKWVDLPQPHYQCGTFRVPLCYDGVCDSDREIDVFVKRVVGRDPPEGEKARSLWVLQGGPGASSVAMEGLMESLYYQTKGHVSIYTMDHRGTGRSHRLDCAAAQAMTPGSPGGSTIRVEEIPACIEDIRFQIDNQTAAFSVTSAAMDLRTVIEGHQADHDVFVYGLSYGTYLVERLIHLAPKPVKGFAVDGIVSESGDTVEKRSTYSNWDHDVGVVGERFLHYCEQDKFCKSKFAHVDDLVAFVKKLYKDLDEAAKTPGKNPCADALGSTDVRPSYFLRTTFGDYIMQQGRRIAIPAVIYRAARCNKEDAEALQTFVEAEAERDEHEEDIEEILYSSEMLYNIVVFSEMWEQPTPDEKTLIQWYEDAVMASDNYYVLPYYCLFTGSKDPACKELKHLPESQPLAYERDQYWNVTAKLPEGVSALLMSGGLDVQTRRTYGELEYNDLEGDRMLVSFHDAGHCTTFTTPTKSGGTCGVIILASYVMANGVLADVDASCIDEVFPLKFEGSGYEAHDVFGTTDLYD